MKKALVGETMVTVIVPVYNVEDYLNKCIESLVHQTYRNLEIILVDDGSTDNSPAICDSWKKTDNRIRVIHKKNGGLSDARNAALDIATGEYIVFVDSDDWVDSDYVNYLRNLLVRENADISICEYRYITPKGHVINHFANNASFLVMEQKQALFELCNGVNYSWSACAKMYKRCMFQSTRFPVGHNFEDLATTYKCFLIAEKVVFGRKALYNYLRRENSIMTRGFEWGRVDAVRYSEEMARSITAQWGELIEVAAKRVFEEYVLCIRSIVLSDIRSDDMDCLLEELRRKVKIVRKYLSFRQLSAKMQCYYYCTFAGRWIFPLAVYVENKLYRYIKLRKRSKE